MLRMFDLDISQRRILERMLPEYQNQSAVEKDKTLKDYLKTIEEDYDERDLQMELEDGFAVTDVARPTGKIFDPEKPLDELEKYRLSRRKKKNDPFKQDFYKIQIKALKDNQELFGKKKRSKPTDEEDGDNAAEGGFFDDQDDDESGEDLFNLGEGLDEDQLNDPDFLQKRKAQLAASFQRQIAEMREKKLKA